MSGEAVIAERSTEESSGLTQVMLDLETLGTRPGSIIVSIGAVAFGYDLPEEKWRTFHSGPISVRDSSTKGLRMDFATLAWWLSQPDPAARQVVADAMADTDADHTLDGALIDFRRFFPQGASVWGNGSDFDVVLLKAAYDACELEAPWVYSAARCFRTFKKELGRLTSEPEFQGVKHDAMNDALHQARWLCAIMKEVNARCNHV